MHARTKEEEEEEEEFCAPLLEKWRMSECDKKKNTTWRKRVQREVGEERDDRVKNEEGEGNSV